MVIAATLAFHAIAQPAARPEFEVATIRLNTDCVNGGGHEQLSPGRFGVECVSLRDYIRGAYGSYGAGRNPNLRPPPVVGGPTWLDADRYDIVAKASPETGLDQMYGPMTRALLEARFRLKVHTEARELPVYTLSLAKGGSKLTATKAGSCVAIDPATVLKSPSPSNYCGGRATTKAGAKKIVDGYGMSLAEFTDRIFRETLDRPVIDKTGLKGLFDIHLEYVADAMVSDGSTSPVNAPGPAILTAVQEQLGLKLSPDKGPVEVIVIDSVERPSENRLSVLARLFEFLDHVHGYGAFRRVEAQPELIGEGSEDGAFR